MRRITKSIIPLSFKTKEKVAKRLIQCFEILKRNSGIHQNLSGSTTTTKGFQQLNHQMQQDRKGMLYCGKGRWEMLYTVLWLTRTNIRWCASLPLVKKNPSVLVLHKVTITHQHLASTPIFLSASICTLKNHTINHSHRSQISKASS